LHNGHLTFASFNRISKLSRSAIALWAQLLRALPDSLMLLGGMPRDGEYDWLIDWFAQEGIARDRLKSYPRCDTAAYLAKYADSPYASAIQRLRAEDFSGETLITYPVPEDRIDAIRHVLKPADVRFKRRTAELTVAILQLVASRRGIAALPSWGIKSYVDHDYVIARRIGARGLWSDLYAATPKDMAAEPYVRDFIAAAKTTCFATLSGLVPLN
jgi:DNA-binding transcriptional LysR family regulator